MPPQIPPIERARQFIAQETYDPVLNSHDTSDRAKNVIRNQQGWLDSFQRVGDLYKYINRFTGVERENDVYDELKALGINTYEDILDEFNQRFGAWQHEVTRFDDFVIGQAYPSREILISAGVYDLRVGGIMPLGHAPAFDAIVIKATLQGNKYPNQWLDEGKKLKYYFKSIGDTFKDTYKENAAILNNPGIPIYTFVRNTSDDPFIYEGAFYYESDHTEANGARWFTLGRTFEGPIIPVVDANYLEKELDHGIEKSKADTSEQRRARLQQASKRPKKVRTVSTGYERNPDVVAEVLARANGYCEICKQEAPFRRKKDNTPYLEVHHVIQLADGGEDTVDNAVGICPNCHRQAHFG